LPSAPEEAPGFEQCSAGARIVGLREILVGKAERRADVPERRLDEHRYCDAGRAGVNGFN
jgi:hypothetical protein